MIDMTLSPEEQVERFGRYYERGVEIAFELGMWRPAALDRGTRTAGLRKSARTMLSRMVDRAVAGDWPMEKFDNLFRRKVKSYIGFWKTKLYWPPGYEKPE